LFFSCLFLLGVIKYYLVLPKEKCGQSPWNPRGPYDTFEKQEQRNGISTGSFEGMSVQDIGLIALPSGTPLD